jgi:hypothetical protein
MDPLTENNILSEYLTKTELAAQLHRSIRSLDRWALTGDGPPCVRIGRRSLYRRAAVIEWLRSLEVTPGRGERNHRRRSTPWRSNAPAD